MELNQSTTMTTSDGGDLGEVEVCPVMGVAVEQHDPWQEIYRRRVAREATEVKDGCPNWLRLALLKRFGARGRYETDGHSVIWHALRRLFDKCPSWLDHWGTVKLHDGRLALAVEPYHIRAAELQEIETLAASVGAEAEVVDGSWHYPGRTIRCIIKQP